MLYDEKLLTTEQQNVENCYQQIGLRYYAYHKENPAPEFADLVASITASKMRMDQHRADVLRANGMRMCPHCHQQTKIGSMYCNSCGLKIQDAAQPAPAAPIAVETEAAAPVASVPADFIPAPAVKPLAAAAPVSAPAEVIPVAVPAPAAEMPVQVSAVPEEPAMKEPEPMVFAPAPVREPVIKEVIPEEPAVKEPVVEEAVSEEPAAKKEEAAPADPQRTMAASEEETVVYQERVEELRGGAEQRKCRNCGAEVPADCAFCMECGTPVEKPANQPPVAPPPAERFCTECGCVITDPEAMFCNNCGTRLSPSEAPAVPAPAFAGKRCPSCGFTTTDTDVQFCMECGSRLI